MESWDLPLNWEIWNDQHHQQRQWQQMTSGLRHPEVASTRGWLCPPSPSSFLQKVKKSHNNIKETSIIGSQVYSPSSGRSCLSFCQVYEWSFLMALGASLCPLSRARELQGLESSECSWPGSHSKVTAPCGTVCLSPCSEQLPNTLLPAWEPPLISNQLIPCVVPRELFLKSLWIQGSYSHPGIFTTGRVGNFQAGDSEQKPEMHMRSNSKQMKKLKERSYRACVCLNSFLRGFGFRVIFCLFLWSSCLRGFLGSSQHKMACGKILFF